jgi:hypothetical protein
MVCDAIGGHFNENLLRQGYPGIKTIRISMPFFEEFCC